MSTVTNLVLTFNVLEDDTDRIREVDAFAYGTYMWTEGRTLWGKTLEVPVWLLAANNLDLKAFVEYVSKQVAWEYPEHVRLYACGQEDPAFYEVPVCGR